MHLFEKTLCLVIGVLTLSLNPGDKLNDLLREKVNGANIQLTELKAKLLAKSKVKDLYEKNGYQPVWVDLQSLNKAASDLFEAIKSADEEGLTPTDYHLNELTPSLQQSKPKELTSAELVDLELLLTDAYLLYATHLFAGKVNPETIDPEWRASRKNVSYDMITHLQEALREHGIKKSLQMLTPRHAEYQMLKKGLKKYKALELEDWSPIKLDRSLKKGDTHEQVPAIRNRLYKLGDLKKRPGTQKQEYDETLLSAVQDYQKRHGLTPDGVIGKQTLDALNTAPAKRVELIRANMERWRWLPEKLGDRYIKVNIANFKLSVIENHTTKLTKKAIVGRPYRKTPVFSAEMTYLVINPTWTVPPTILQKDILPEVRKNPNYLKQKNMKLLQNGKEVNPMSVNWSAVSTQNFPYTIRQEPGANNALGDIKFMFPNKYSVYIHDTPTKELFEQTERAFSSGCIRLHEPVDLALYLLSDQQQWNASKIDQVISTRKETTVKLSRPIPVYLLYLTALTEEEVIHFRKDIYERDAALIQALSENPAN